MNHHHTMITEETHENQKEPLGVDPPTFSELMARLRHTAVIRDGSVEDRLATLKSLLMLPRLELEGVSEENWTLICCLE